MNDQLFKNFITELKANGRFPNVTGIYFTPKQAHEINKTLWSRKEVMTSVDIMSALDYFTNFIKPKVKEEPNRDESANLKTQVVEWDAKLAGVPREDCDCLRCIRLRQLGKEEKVKVLRNKINAAISPKQRYILQLRNETDLKFTDISSEEWRRYDFADDGIPMRIVSPQWLNVSASGGHRILDAEGICHYIPAGWKHLSWKAKQGEPHFVA